MTGFTKQGSRVTKALGAAAVALLMLGAGCGQEIAGGDPKISTDDDRGSGGVLEGLTIKGSKFTPNGEVLITALLVGNGPNPSQYIEEKVQANSDGKIEFERRPMPCPQATGYGSGSWTWVTARDTASGISSSKPLTPGSTPDCTGG
ncbi:MAG TPA: hypothetical protein VMZ73_00070 [Acidimicrobiales bacterium]|nr:hypothetical protein [Acidimicrobiales bacterium]